uniref:Related to endo-1,4-beta-xylanase b n=1 Tax=Melanopsichium pennsylvanicum 4 TaxID=1398559 RepID=A0A077QSF6_9BASI|nr:related to endo-1,4-beta-xylanase b [Melanopsichium pennsylvanicum 4]
MQILNGNEDSWAELLNGVTDGASGTESTWNYHTVVWVAQTSNRMMLQSSNKETMMKPLTVCITTKMLPKIINEANFWGIDVLNEVFDNSGNATDHVCFPGLSSSRNRISRLALAA